VVIDIRIRAQARSALAADLRASPMLSAQRATAQATPLATDLGSPGDRFRVYACNTVSKRRLYDG
jgi:hypothetical protein